MKGMTRWMLLGGLLLAALMSGCDAAEAGTLKASGVIEVVEVMVSAEAGGRVDEVLVSEGDRVSEGEALLLMENELLESEHARAAAAVESTHAQLEAARLDQTAAEASLKTAEASLEAVQLEYDYQLSLARAAVVGERTEGWVGDDPVSFDLPPWYFNQHEEIEAAIAELEAAEADLEVERSNFESVINDASNADILAAEERLSAARAAFLVADELRDRRLDQQDREVMEDNITVLYDSAEAELDNAQKEYDRLLLDQSAEDVLEARARLAVAQERVETALDLLQGLQTGSEALPVQIAAAGVRQAEAAVTQAEAFVEQAAAGVQAAGQLVAEAEAALASVELQLDKLEMKAPTEGVLLTRSVEEGELLQAGMAAFLIGRMEEMTITVYLPEDRYGQVSLQDQAKVSVDSFPGEVFEASVVWIADEAEYTPRNVQTEEDRRTTVYAIRLDVEDLEGKLKPGMPADVVFSGE